MFSYLLFSVFFTGPCLFEVKFCRTFLPLSGSKVVLVRGHVISSHIAAKRKKLIWQKTPSPLPKRKCDDMHMISCEWLISVLTDMIVLMLATSCKESPAIFSMVAISCLPFVILLVLQVRQPSIRILYSARTPV